ncbi:MAG TPA: feruloyl-CoA synthase [Thermoleophilaceae bacterium]
MTTPAQTQLFAPPRVTLERRSDGSILLRSEDPLREHERSIAHVLRRRAEEHPERVLATQPDPGGGPRRSLTFGEARAQADAVAQSLLDLGLNARRPVMVLSGNSLEHLVMMLGCYTAGVPVMPVSVAYSLMSKDHARIRELAQSCSPGLVFAEEPERFAPAFRALAGLVPASPPFGQLAASRPGQAVEDALAEVGPDTIAKLLFTSGSTGAPKGVINTHRMLLANQQILLQNWPFLAAEPPVLVDWLPWSHVFGGNHNLNQVLVHGGTLHIDEGKPAPPLFPKTLEALRENSPTVYYNVPAGFALLTPELENDPEFAAAFFSRLRFVFYAAAALPQGLWDRLRAVTPDHIPLTAAWGTTETTATVTSAHFASARCGCIGVPVPGVELKLAFADDRFEMRVKGPNVTPGYYADPVASAAAFDSEGFYRTGDAGKLVDEDGPNQGLMFDGRLAENFKLTSGSFVAVGALRGALVTACGGVLSDAVICGHDEAFASALAWVNDAEAQRVCGGDPERLRAHLSGALARMNADVGSASQIQRLLLLDEPANLDAGEITDKGYVNQRAVLERRAELVRRLYADPPDADVILPT